MTGLNQDKGNPETRNICQCKKLRVMENVWKFADYT
jgi:hypothetical protein